MDFVYYCKKYMCIDFPSYDIRMQSLKFRLLIVDSKKSHLRKIEFLAFLEKYMKLRKK